MRITQPSLTKSIRLLEQDLGVQLFRRLPRGVELTQFGTSLARHARSVRVQVKDALGEIESLRQGVSGRITIGAGPSWLRRLLPRAIGMLIEEHPLVRIEVVGGFDEALLRGLAWARSTRPLWRSRPWRSAPTSTSRARIRPARRHRAGGPSAGRAGTNTAADCLAFPWVLPPRATRARRRLDALFVSRELPPPDATVETQSAAFMVALLAASDALTYTTRRTVEQAEATGMVVIDVPDLAAERTAGFITRRGQTKSPTLEALLRPCRRWRRRIPQPAKPRN